MAFVGLRKPMVGKMTNEKTYEKPEACGKAIGITVTPSYAEGGLYGDDAQVEYDKEFRYADVSLNTTRSPGCNAQSYVWKNSSCRRSCL